MRWDRLALALATAACGLGGGYAILAWGAAPKAFVAFSGLLILVGLAAAIVLFAFAWITVEEDLRPRFVFRKPAVNLSLAHRGAELNGRSQWRTHPIKFWGGLTFNHRFMIGFLVFDNSEYLDVREDKQ